MNMIFLSAFFGVLRTNNLDKNRLSYEGLKNETS